MTTLRQFQINYCFQAIQTMTSQIDALVVGQNAMNARLDALEAKYCPSIARQTPQSQSDPSPPTPPQQQPNLLAKKKRNQKTRQQHKRKQAQAKAQRVSIQEVEHTYGQEVDSLRISVGKASKHVFLQYIWECCWHAVISYVGMTSFDGMIMVQNGAICMRRMGVG